MQFSKSAALVACALALLGAAVATQGAAAETSRTVVSQADKPSGSGTINSVDAAGRKVNMTHGPVTALKWPGMTMDFPVAEGVKLDRLKPNGKVRFRIREGKDGRYVIDAINPSPPIPLPKGEGSPAP